MHQHVKILLILTVVANITKSSFAEDVTVNDVVEPQKFVPAVNESQPESLSTTTIIPSVTPMNITALNDTGGTMQMNETNFQLLDQRINFTALAFTALSTLLASVNHNNSSSNSSENISTLFKLSTPMMILHVVNIVFLAASVTVIGIFIMSFPKLKRYVKNVDHNMQSYIPLTERL